MAKLQLLVLKEQTSTLDSSGTLSKYNLHTAHQLESQLQCTRARALSCSLVCEHCK